MVAKERVIADVMNFTVSAARHGLPHCFENGRQKVEIRGHTKTTKSNWTCYSTVLTLFSLRTNVYKPTLYVQGCIYMFCNDLRINRNYYRSTVTGFYSTVFTLFSLRTKVINLHFMSKGAFICSVKILE
jgi:hypothetical protein